MFGTVKFFNTTKGWGFITSDEGGDVFVHKSALERSGVKDLRENDRVSFVAVASKKGENAENIKVI